MTEARQRSWSHLGREGPPELVNAELRYRQDDRAELAIRAGSAGADRCRRSSVRGGCAGLTPLESGHYFKPHTQRITQARATCAKVIVLDTRLSPTATHAHHWLSPQPRSEATINLAIANHLIATRRYDGISSAGGGNWADYLAASHPGQPRRGSRRYRRPLDQRLRQPVARNR